jgi:hypothetical protein
MYICRMQFFLTFILLFMTVFHIRSSQHLQSSFYFFSSNLSFLWVFFCCQCYKIILFYCTLNSILIVIQLLHIHNIFYRVFKFWSLFGVFFSLKFAPMAKFHTNLVTLLTILCCSCEEVTGWTIAALLALGANENQQDNHFSAKVVEYIGRKNLGSRLKFFEILIIQDSWTFNCRPALFSFLKTELIKYLFRGKELQTITYTYKWSFFAWSNP